MGTVIALDLLSTHPEYFSKAVLIATGDGLIPPFIFENLLLVLQICFHMRLFPVLPSHISVYWNFSNKLD
jgi:pimeloyl-ACP methyl ester carboxylesterase